MADPPGRERGPLRRAGALVRAEHREVREARRALPRRRVGGRGARGRKRRRDRLRSCDRDPVSAGGARRARRDRWYRPILDSFLRPGHPIANWVTKAKASHVRAVPEDIPLDALLARLGSPRTRSHLLGSYLLVSGPKR